MDKHSIESIDLTTFDELLKQYPDVVPTKLLGLDTQRYETLPRLLRDQDKPKSLEKEQVATLVDWKLSHGKFRPTLKALVNQNSNEFVQETSKDGFEAFTGTTESVKASLNILTRLKGIGPATAALLMSVYEPETAPFFSDELFRWCFFEDGKGKGWEREIKYTLKEYLELFGKVQGLRARFKKDFGRNIGAVDIEKVAYVLGKQGVGGRSGQASSHGQKRKMGDEVEEVAKASRNDTRSTPATSNKKSGKSNQSHDSTSKNPTAASTRTRRSQK